jgi:hypothetical protein
MTTNNNNGNLILTANPHCSICKGSGAVDESHGETLDCECVFDRPLTEEEDAMIDAGRFTVNPAPEYLARMDALDRDTRNHDAWIDNALHSACEGDCGDMD